MPHKLFLNMEILLSAVSDYAATLGCLLIPYVFYDASCPGSGRRLTTESGSGMETLETLAAFSIPGEFAGTEAAESPGSSDTPRLICCAMPGLPGSSDSRLPPVLTLSSDMVTDAPREWRALDVVASSSLPPFVVPPKLMNVSLFPFESNSAFGETPTKDSPCVASLLEMASLSFIRCLCRRLNNM